ncbi:MAG: tetratricopeptide repeat protein [bacterium]|nr:MAG: tetratricopeptide repeat protein [bacterium]
MLTINLRRIRCVLLATIAVLLALAHLSQPEAGETEDLRFARRLRDDGMYIAAAEEFLRFAEKYPRSIFRPEALVSAGESYMQAGKAIEALETFDTFLAAYSGDQRACTVRYYRGSILKSLKRYREGAEELLVIPDTYSDCPLVGQALLDAGEYLLSAGDFAQASLVLRRLINEHTRSDLLPRARYSLALALGHLGRDLEAETTLDDLVKKHPRSPVAALALLKLGERARGRGDTESARRHFTRVLDGFEEKSLQERASFHIIEIFVERGDDTELLDESKRYLSRYPESARRGSVYREAIQAAWRLDEYDEALSFINELQSEGAMADSTGELQLLTGKVLARMQRMDDALAALATLRHTFPRSPHRREALILEAELLHRKDSPHKAARIYHLALLEGAEDNERLMIISRLASLSIEGLGDTLSALRYWDTIADGAPGSDLAEQALWNSGRIRERIGDHSGAAADYRQLLEHYPSGTYIAEAGKRLDYLDLLHEADRSSMRNLARIASSGWDRAERKLRAAIVLLDNGGDRAGAMELLTSLLEQELPDSIRAGARYYLGKAFADRFSLAQARGEDAGKDRREALSLWLDVAREYHGTHWGDIAHRGYIGLKLPEWKPHERCEKLDEYIGYYGDGDGRWWALAEKLDVLYGLAQAGAGWAADSALAVSREILDGAANEGQKCEAALKRGYLFRLKNDPNGSAHAFEEFVLHYGDDPRAVPVLYDLGETLIKLKDYHRARTIFERCLARGPRRSLAEKCTLRLGDCSYSQSRFKGAAERYAGFAKSYPNSTLADEALYREALSRDRLGEHDRVDALLTQLEKKSGLSQSLRARVIRMLGARMLGRGDAEAALPFLEELVSLRRSAESLVLLGTASFETGAPGQAVRHYSDALKFDGADSSRVLAGRAKAYFGLGEFKKGDRDLEILRSLAPGGRHLPAVLLERGRVLADKGRCEEATETLQGIRDTYPGTAEAASALYYLALCDLKRGGYEPAIQKLNALLVESPGSPITDQVYFKLASAHYASGNLNLSAQHYALAAEATSDRDFSFLALRNLGRIYQELEEWEKAADAWSTITEHYPEHEDIVEIFFNLGFSYSQAGRYDMAYEVFTRIPAIARSEEQQGRAHYWSGSALKGLGRYQEAVREFLRVPYLKTGGMWGVTSKLEAAACYELMDAVDQAEKIYLDVIASHGAGSDWGRVAQKGLDRLRMAGEKDEEEGQRDSDGGGNGPGPPDDFGISGCVRGGRNGS